MYKLLILLTACIISLANGLAVARPGPDSNYNLSIGGGGGNTPTFVQGNTHQNGSGSVTSANVVLGATVSSGSTVIAVFCGVGVGASDAITFTDDKSNSYTTVLGTPVTNTGATYGCNVGYALNITNAPQTITGTSNFTRTFVTIVADEYSNILASGALDGSAGNPQSSPGTGTNAVTSTNITTTATNDLVWGFGVSINSTGFSTGTGFTGHQAVGSTFYTESLIKAVAGTQAATFTATNGSDQTIAIALGFKHS